ncbi:MAG: TIGR00730 family Rossman fold protein [Bacteroidota bacterium]
MKKLEKSPKAYKNLPFLHSKGARGIRILSEFYEPLSRFEHFKIKGTIVVFGSARIKSPQDARRDFMKLQNQSTKIKSTLKFKKEFEKAKVAIKLSKYYKEAVELSRLLTLWSNKLKEPNHFTICTGGGPGIMEAANKGAYLGKGKNIGLNISLPFEQFPNPYITPELNFEFHYFFMRKFWFMYLGKALIAFPGGFGTFDELMELLTLMQTSKIKKKITVILYGKEYWDDVVNMKKLVEYGMISEEDLNLFQYASTPKDAFNILKKELLINYPLETASQNNGI